MQNSELFRRGIVLPLDDQAEQHLRLNESNIGMQVEYLPIESDELFESIWSCGLFREINQQCGTLIDDYEEDFVDVSDIDTLINVLETVATNVKAEHGDVRSFFVDLHALTKKALNATRPLLFVM